MYKVIVFLIGFGLCSCSSFSQSNSSKQASANSKFVDQQITDQILQHYRQQNNSDSIKKDVTDTTIEVTLYAKEDAQYNFDGTIYISKMQSDYFHGDLYGDGVEEIVCSVSTEGMGGGNAYWNDVFVLRLIDKKYKIIDAVTSNKLTGDKGGYDGGLFYPLAIKDRLITGESICWTDEDAHCCPSLKFYTTVKFEKDKLVFNSRKPMKNISNQTSKNEIGKQDGLK